MTKHNLDMKQPCKYKVFLVDDHPVVRQGLTSLINQEHDLVVCGTAADAATALLLLDQLKPDIAVLDLSLPGADGVDLVRRVFARFPKLPVLVLSMYDETLFAERVVRAGARGYVMKQEATANVLVGIRQVLSGAIHLSPKMTAHLLEEVAHPQVQAKLSPLDQLSDRELQIYEMIGRGHRAQEIADKLGVSLKTIETHRDRIRKKLQLADAHELSQQAVIWIQQSCAAAANTRLPAN
jgi:DNA-binding NarL/FixJ family response regulator